MRPNRVTILAAAFVVLALAAPLAAQTPIAAADFQRLQDNVVSAGADLAQLRSSDAKLADQLQSQLDDLRDEVAYLKVKQRREGNVTRADFLELLDRIDALRARARGDRPAEVQPRGARTAGAAPASGARTDEIPVGTELDVRLQTALSSGTALVEDRFEATTVVDLGSGDRVLVPAGSVLRGVVRSVDKATRTDRKGALTLAFDQITIHGKAFPMRATVTQALESGGIRSEAGRIGASAGVGAIIGGILGGIKGALAGILIGAGGTVAATPGRDVELPPGTVLRLRFDSALSLR